MQDHELRDINDAMHVQYVGCEGTAGYEMRRKREQDNIAGQARLLASFVSNALFFGMLILFALFGFVAAVAKAWLASVEDRPSRNPDFAVAIINGTPDVTDTDFISALNDANSPSKEDGTDANSPSKEDGAVTKTQAILVITSGSLLVLIAAVHWSSLLPFSLHSRRLGTRAAPIEDEHRFQRDAAPGQRRDSALQRAAKSCCPMRWRRARIAARKEKVKRAKEAKEWLESCKWPEM